MAQTPLQLAAIVAVITALAAIAVSATAGEGAVDRVLHAPALIPAWIALFVAVGAASRSGASRLATLRAGR